MENGISTINTSTHNQPSFNLEQTQSLVHPAPVIGHHGVEPPKQGYRYYILFLAQS